MNDARLREDLERLPRRARVAFAARCVVRGLHISDAAGELRDKTESALWRAGRSLAMFAASSARSEVSALALSDARHALAAFTGATTELEAYSFVAVESALDAARAVAVADQHDDAYSSDSGLDSVTAVKSAYDAYSQVLAAAQNCGARTEIGGSARHDAASAAEADLRLLATLSEEAGWSNFSAAASDFGHIWPGGDPDWLRTRTLTPLPTDEELTADGERTVQSDYEIAKAFDEHWPLQVREGIVLRVVVDPGSAPPEKIARILGLYSNLYQALGGSGISFELQNVYSLEGTGVL